MATFARITGWGKCVPEKVLTNRELAPRVGTTDEDIRALTGIRERHIASEDESSSSLATEASRRALAQAGLAAEDIQLIIMATDTPDKMVPASAFLVQDALGAKNAAAFDLIGGCSGFVYAMAVGTQFVQTGAYHTVLVVSGEVISRILNWEDRSTCILFGDGAAAVVLQASDSPGAISFALGSDGSNGKLILVPGQCDRPRDVPPDRRYYVTMKGRQVFRSAVANMADVSRQAVAKAGMRVSDIDLLIPHQANERIVRAVAHALELPIEKVFINVDRYGNMGAASPAVALCEAVEEGRIKEGSHVLLVSFGAGLSWAAILLKWGAGAPRPLSLTQAAVQGELVKS